MKNQRYDIKGCNKDYKTTNQNPETNKQLTSQRTLREREDIMKNIMINRIVAEYNRLHSGSYNSELRNVRLTVNLVLVNFALLLANGYIWLH